MRQAGYAKDYASLLVFFNRLLDALLIFTSGTVCFYALKPFKHFPDYSGWLPNSYLHAIGIAILLAAWWFPAFNVYRSWRGAGLFSELGPLASAWSASMVGLVAFIFFTKTADDYSRHWLALWFGSALVAMLLARLALRLLLRQLRKRGRNLRRVILVGNASKSIDIARRIDAAPWLGLVVEGYFGDADAEHAERGLIRLGALTELLAYL